MVAHVLRLRLALLLAAGRNRLRGVAGVLAAAALTAAVVVALARIGTAPSHVAVVVLVLAGSAVSAGFLLVPLLAPVRDVIDPRRFAVVGASWRQVAVATLVAAPVGVPGIALIVVGVALAGTWRAHGVDVLLAVAGAVCVVVTHVLLARVALGIAAVALAERRSRELTALFLLAVIVVAIPVAVFLGSLDWGDGVPPALVSVVDVLMLTPLGAVWALPMTPGPVVVLVAIATPVLLAGAWFLLVRRMLTEPERPVSVRERRGLGWFTITPGTPGGAIAARAIIYWLRDPRYLVDVAVIPVAAVAAVVPLLIVGVPATTVAVIPALVIALLLGWVVHNDLAYDGSAIWLHVSSAVRGASDRIGRLVPLLLVAVPLLAVAVSVGVGLHGDWGMLPAVAGSCTALLLGGLGCSSVSSVLAPYAVARPGESPFQQPQRTGGGLAQGAVITGSLIVAAPALWATWRYLDGDADAQWWALAYGAGAGVVVLATGILVGGALFDRRSDRVMVFAETT